MDSLEDFLSDSSSDNDRKRGQSYHAVAVQPHPIEFARSQYANWEPPYPEISEYEAFHQLQTQRDPSDHSQFLNIDLAEFEIYRTPLYLKRAKGNQTNARTTKEYELTSLHQSGPRTSDLCFSGTITVGQESFFLQDIPVKCYSIEGYFDDENPGTTIYLQSLVGSKFHCDVWYKLCVPSASYRSFHNNFKWIATFGKHVLDFLDARDPGTVTLNHFRTSFIAWCSARFSTHSTFSQWHKAFRNNSDFRHAVNAYVDYLYNQAADLADSSELLSHPVWQDCKKGGNAVKEQPIVCQKTTTTPFVYNCFKSLYFGSQLERHPLSEKVQKEQEHKKSQLGFPMGSSPTTATDSPPILSPEEQVFKVGDVIGIHPDQDGDWKTRDKVWLAYVQQVEDLDGDVQRLFVIWLYRPTDTIMADMSYPVGNELFLSDNCNCTEQKLFSTEVIRRYTVDWCPTNLSTTTKDFHISRKYVVEHECAFVSIKDSDFRCTCLSPKPVPVKHMGDTVYIKTRKSGHENLDPVVVQDWNSDKKQVLVRRLLRRSKICAIEPKNRKRTPARNELVWTDELFIVPISKIDRNCYVRFFSFERVIKDIPTPYDRRGNGDLWYLCSRVASTSESGQSIIEHMTMPPWPLKQGYDPCLSPSEHLRGLSIFSGGGNLDRGIEDGGVVKFTHACDISQTAIHTQLANSDHNLTAYWGSVDDYQKSLSLGHTVKTIAKIGEIDFIAAGSPCPGFSLLQRDWLSEQSLRNSSHITTFCSFVDIYRPQYAVLENVVTMTRVHKGFEKEKVFSQLIACLVGLGYQVQQHLMDGWNYSSSQQRTRVIISIAAPGLEPIPQPYHTHSHPDPDDMAKRGLGKDPNGNPFGCREVHPTPFKFISAGESTADLPDIGSNLGHVCIPFPDHRILSTNSKVRDLIKRIPTTHSKLYGYASALELGLIPQGLRTRERNYGKAYTRINPAGQIPTLTTRPSPHDSFCGNLLHWTRPTALSVQEARRAQGFPDDEVIIGSRSEQFAVIGNAVDRNVSLAIGLSLRKAVEKNHQEGKKPFTKPFPVASKLRPAYQTEQDPLTFEDEHESDAEIAAPTVTAKPTFKAVTPGGHYRSPVILDSETESDSEPVQPIRKYSQKRQFRRAIIEEQSTASSDDSEPIRPPNRRHSKLRRVILQDEYDEISFVEQRQIFKSPKKSVVFQDESDEISFVKERQIFKSPRKASLTSTMTTRTYQRRRTIEREASALNSSSSTDILAQSISPQKSASESDTSLSSCLDPLHVRGTPRSRRRQFTVSNATDDDDNNYDDDMSGTSSSGLDPLNVRGKRSRESIDDTEPPRKRTRHSGLKAEFAPKRWNKLVEREAKKVSLKIRSPAK